MDLDEFEQLREGLGSVIAERLVQIVGRRLHSCARSCDVVGPQESGGFAILVPGLRYLQDATVIADRVLRVLRAPYHLDHLGGRKLQLTASIGIVAYPDDGSETDTLLKNARLALRLAKNRGCGQHQYLREEMNVRAPQWQSLEGAVQLAVERRDFLLHDELKSDLEGFVA